MTEINDMISIPSPEAQKLLSQTSAEIKQKRKSQMVKFTEIEEIILDFPGTVDGREVYKIIGLSPRIFNEDKNRNTARLTTKYALLGLLAEQQQKSNHQFTHHELGLIFSALTQHIQTRATPYQQEVKDLQLLVMNMMVEDKN